MYAVQTSKEVNTCKVIKVLVQYWRQTDRRLIWKISNADSSATGHPIN